MFHMQMPEDGRKHKSSHTTWYDVVRQRREEDIEYKLNQQAVWYGWWSPTGLLKSLAARVGRWMIAWRQRLQALTARNVTSVDVTSEASCGDA